MKSKLAILLTVALSLPLLATAAAPKPPRGFTALFNGQDLTGWRGGDTFDPRKLDAMPAAERAKKIAEWTSTMREHWRAEQGELVNDGKGAYATTEKEYGNFELLVEYRTVPKADSGIYLRGCPQVQIWDYTEESKFKIGADKGSGGLWNNSAGAPGKDPLVKADKPFGSWNQFRIIMVGSRVSVWLNGKLVVDFANMENYYDRKQPVPARGPICLQTHGGEIRWRNIFIRELSNEESVALLRSKGNAKFRPLFNGKNLEGWLGATNACAVEDKALVWQAGKGGTLYHAQVFTNFSVRFEFKVPPGGNNGLAIRYPGEGDTAYLGMCELQVLDQNYDQVKNTKLDPRQYHGSAYGMAAAAQGYQFPVGEWNFQQVTVTNSSIRVELNGTVILNTDLSQVNEYLAGKAHPGKNRESGYFGFAGHNDPVAFRNVTARQLP
jgi:hypothetical protein